MNYSDEPGSCRADFFKESGKWYTTDVINMNDLFYHRNLTTAVKQAVAKRMGTTLTGMTVVVLEPYHQNAYPISFVKGE
jgi:hypothetical protein